MSKKKRPLTAEEKKRKKRSALTTWALVLVMLLGLGIMAYPMVSDWWNSFHASRAIASYSNAVENVDKEKLDEMIRAAHEYNEKLLKKAAERWNIQVCTTTNIMTKSSKGRSMNNEERIRYHHSPRAH